MVFAGTEVGVTGYKDPFNRKPYPWDNIDEELLRHYRELGKMRNQYRDFFETAIDFRNEIFSDRLELSRMNSKGEQIVLSLNRVTERFEIKIAVYSN